MPQIIKSVQLIGWRDSQSDCSGELAGELLSICLIDRSTRYAFVTSSMYRACFEAHRERLFDKKFGAQLAGLHGSGLLVVTSMFADSTGQRSTIERLFIVCDNVLRWLSQAYHNPPPLST